MRHTSNRGSAALFSAGSKRAPFGYGITSMAYSGGRFGTLVRDNLVVESRGAGRDGRGYYNAAGLIGTKSPESASAFRQTRERAQKD
jgi:hypothetical protein